MLDPWPDGKHVITAVWCAKDQYVSPCSLPASARGLPLTADWLLFASPLLLLIAEKASWERRVCQHFSQPGPSSGYLAKDQLDANLGRKGDLRRIYLPSDCWRRFPLPPAIWATTIPGLPGLTAWFAKHACCPQGYRVAGRLIEQFVPGARRDRSPHWLLCIVQRLSNCKVPWRSFRVRWNCPRLLTGTGCSCICFT